MSEEFLTDGYLGMAYLLPGDAKTCEYFCTNCLQLRLSFVDVVNCKNCGSARIITGLPGKLDKEALMKKYSKGESMGKVISVDFTGVESGGIRGVHVPEGDYGIQVDKVELKKGEESGKPYLLFYMKLTKGNKKGVGKTVPHNCSLQKQSLWNLRNLLESFGMTVPSKAVKLPFEKLVGKECAGTLVDDEYEGRKKSVFGAFFPLSELGKTSDTADELEEDEELGTEEEEEKPPKKKRKKKPEEEEEETETTSDEEEELFA